MYIFINEPRPLSATQIHLSLPRTGGGGGDFGCSEVNVYQKTSFPSSSLILLTYFYLYYTFIERYFENLQRQKNPQNPQALGFIIESLGGFFH